MIKSVYTYTFSCVRACGAKGQVCVTFRLAHLNFETLVYRREGKKRSRTADHLFCEVWQVAGCTVGGIYRRG